MSTSPLNQEQTVRARKNNAVLMQRLASVGNAPVAFAVGCDEATISRMKPEKPKLNEDRKSTRLNSSHGAKSRMPSSA